MSDYTSMFRADFLSMNFCNKSTPFVKVGIDTNIGVIHLEIKITGSLTYIMILILLNPLLDRAQLSSLLLHVSVVGATTRL